MSHLSNTAFSDRNPYALQEKQGAFKLVRCLTKKHLWPSNFQKKKVLPELLPFFTTGKSSIPNYPFYELAMFRAIYLYWLIYLYLNFIVFPNLRLNVTVPKSNCIVKFPRPDAVLEKNIVCIEFFTNFNWANVSISVYHLCFTVPL